MTITPEPFRFDGHGINDNEGQRICKVTSCEPYSDGNKRNAEFDRLSNLFAAAPQLLLACQTALNNLKPLYGANHIVIERLNAAIDAAEKGAQ